jgi:hypothetical protein
MAKVRAAGFIVLASQLCVLLSVGQFFLANAGIAAMICGDAGVLARRCGNVVFDGDSISSGIGTSADKRPDTLFIQGLGIPAEARNVAGGGRPVWQCLSLFPKYVEPYFVADARFNLIVFHAGDNDIRQDRSATDTYHAFAAYVALAHAQGWKVIVSTELPRPDFPPAREAELETYNLMLVSNSAHADAVVNLADAPQLNDPSTRVTSGLYTVGHVHPNDAGYAILNALLVKSARSLF